MIIAMIALVASLWTDTSTYAADSSNQVKQYVPANLNKVQLGSGSTIELINASLIPNATDKTLAVTMLYTNGSNSTIDLFDYWIRIKMKNKSTNYPVKLVPSDKDSTKVAARSTKTLTYYSIVSADFEISNLIVDIIKWNLDSSNPEVVVGSITPSKDIFTVPQGYQYTAMFSGIELGTYIEKAIISKNEKYYKPTIYVELTNHGKSQIAISNLQYYILTQEGYLYQLQQNGNKEMTIDPKMNKEVVLRGNIPSTVKDKDWKLVIAQPLTDTKDVLPIATYSLPASTQQTGNDLNKEYTFTDNNGLYNVKINSITRSPLESQDIITANITIKNMNTDPLPVPTFAGKFTLDNVINADASVVQPNKVLAIQPNSQIDIYMYAMIPYTYEFTELTLDLQEKISGGDNEDVSSVLEVTGKDVFTEIPQLASDEEYTIAHVGNSSTYKALAVKTYLNSASKIYTAQIEVTNNEKRSANILNFSAYIKTSDGNVFPAKIAEIKDKMVPGGKALLSIMSTVPSTYKVEDATLIFGEAAQAPSKDANAETPGASTEIAYFNPIELMLPKELDGNLSDIRDIEFYPYKFTVGNVKSQILYGEGKLVLDFNYNLEKNLLVQTGSETPKIIIEVLDEKNNISFTNEYSLESGETGSKVLKLGSNEGKFEATDPDIVFKIETMKNDYKLNIYEQIQPGYKKLIGTREIRWFSFSE